MKYFVMYATMNKKIGANPLYHAFILLITAKKNKKMKVVAQWGFYALPSTERKSLISKIKINFLDGDLTGNHGVLRHEPIRFLDKGKGLQGIAFELTKNDFYILKDECEDTEKVQNQAINEIAIEKKYQAKPPSETRIYAYEDHGIEILAHEIDHANDERPPRIQPYHVLSHNCKSQAITLLSKVLTKEKIALLGRTDIPRWSGDVKPFFLFSKGQLFQHQKRDNTIAHYRDESESKVKLYLTSPPQKIIPLKKKTTQLFYQHSFHAKEINAVISALQRIEWVLIDAQSPHEQYRNGLIEKIRETYQAFSIVPSSNTKKNMVTGLQGWFCSLFNKPRNENEARILAYISQAKYLLNDIYFAIADRWTIDLNHPMNTILQVGENENLINPVEAIAHYLSEKDQKEICSILGRSHINELKK